MPDHGLKISDTGVDVLSATGTGLTFSSERNNLKVGDARTTSILTDAVFGEGTTTVSHGQPFVPYVVAFLEDTDGTFIPEYGIVGNSIGSIFSFYMSGNSDIVFSLELATVNTTYNVIYYVSETESAE